MQSPVSVPPAPENDHFGKVETMQLPLFSLPLGLSSRTQFNTGQP